MRRPLPQPRSPVPHPQWRDREFVTGPLRELGADSASWPRSKRPRILHSPAEFAARAHELAQTGERTYTALTPMQLAKATSTLKGIDALRTYEGAVVLVTHDPGAVRALEPERVIVLPDGTEDLWNDEYMEIVELA